MLLRKIKSKHENDQAEWDAEKVLFKGEVAEEQSKVSELKKAAKAQNALLAAKDAEVVHKAIGCLAEKCWLGVWLKSAGWVFG